MAKFIKEINNSLTGNMEKNENIYLLGEDICDPYGGAFKVTKGISTKFPTKVINTPISEAGICGVITGMALRGFVPIMEVMFSDFLTLMVDQILSNISKMPWMYANQVELPLVIRTPIGGRRGYGPTHSQSIEKILFGMPFIKIVCPTPVHPVSEILSNCIEDKMPVFFLEYKLFYSNEVTPVENGRTDEWNSKISDDKYPVVNMSTTNFEDDEFTVVTYGGMYSIVRSALEKIAYEEELFGELIVPSLISPFNLNDIVSSLSKTRRLVVVEEAGITNGWGAEIIAKVVEYDKTLIQNGVKRVASLDLPIGTSRELEEALLPDENDVINAIKDLL